MAAQKPITTLSYELTTEKEVGTSYVGRVYAHGKTPLVENANKPSDCYHGYAKPGEVAYVLIDNPGVGKLNICMLRSRRYNDLKFDEAVKADSQRSKFERLGKALLGQVLTDLLKLYHPNTELGITAVSLFGYRQNQLSMRLPQYYLSLGFTITKTSKSDGWAEMKSTLGTVAKVCADPSRFAAAGSPL